MTARRTYPLEGLSKDKGTWVLFFLLEARRERGISNL
jgi:hypothetical protein